MTAKVVWKGFMTCEGHSIHFDVREDEVIVEEIFNEKRMPKVSISIDNAISKQHTLENLGYEFS